MTQVPGCGAPITRETVRVSAERAMQAADRASKPVLTDEEREEAARWGEKIVAAAVRFPVGEPFCEGMWMGKRTYPDFLTVSAPPPARHGTLLHPLSARGIRVAAHDQGFLTSRGRFVSREEALKIAVAGRQPLIEHGSRHPTQLFSEDLW
ncbi:hypothetical protein [Sphingomonas sp. ACRSK]|uniref:hypothetical protein n=1 Tax=Sphingomonas sp. ACRSK TaxID=2918213 RepID=UPI001EF6FA73|nr:hypothetical protein [Sphingomonas sp. ACRSK]MCG7348870.1 hypothetical protein [Sphingomonas sp. ACRSK]